MSQAATKSDARERLVATADRLFYAEGIHTVGIDRVIAEAGVAKMTLYNHFASKDELVQAVLRRRDEAVLGFFEESVAKHRKRGKNPLEAFFATLKQWFKGDEFRGCAFINASVETPDPTHPAALFAAGHKRRFHAMIAQLAEETAGERGRAAAPAIALLVEGAIVAAVMQQAAAPAETARKAALAMVSE